MFSNVKQMLAEWVGRLSRTNIDTGRFLVWFSTTNFAWIVIEFLHEIGEISLGNWWLLGAASLANLVLVWLYFRHGRSSLTRIPVVAIATALLTAITGILLALPEFGVFSLEGAYRIAQLFVGESAWTDRLMDRLGKNHAEQTAEMLLNVARSAALVATVSSLLAVSRRFVDWAKVSVPPWKWTDHVVLCGLGEAGMEFVKCVAEDQSKEPRGYRKKLLVVERDDTNPNVEATRNMGVPVLVGDVFSEATRERACLHRARYLILMLPDDKRNIELAIDLRRWIRLARDGMPMLSRRFGAWKPKPPRILIHVDDTRLARRLQDPSYAGVEEYTETRFFDFYESSARALLAKHPLDVYTDLQRAKMAHLAIYGFGKMGHAVLRQAVRQARFPGGQGLDVTIFDQGVGEADFEAGFWQANPGLRRLQHGDEGYQPLGLNIQFLKLNDARCGINLQRLYECVAESTPPPTQHVICFDDDVVGATFAMQLRDTLRERKPLKIEDKAYSWDAPIFVRLQRRHGLARLFLESASESDGENNSERETPDSLFAFGMLDDIVEPKALIGAHRDELAKILHEDGYRKTRRMQERNPAQNLWRKQTQVPWEHLPLHYKSSNRAQADHIEVKLRGLRHTVAEPSIEAPEKSLARPGVVCFEPIDRIFDAGKSGATIVTVQRIYSDLPVVTCWESAQDGEYTARQVPLKLGELDDWAEKGKKFRNGWRKAAREIKKLQREFGIPDITGPRDPLLNHDSGNKAELVKVEDSGAGERFSIRLLDKNLYPFTITGLNRPSVQATYDAWPWVLAVMESDVGQGGRETFVTALNVGAAERSVEVGSENTIRLPQAETGCAEFALKVTDNADANTCGVICWLEADNEDAEPSSTKSRVGDFTVSVLGRTSSTRLRMPPGIDREYTPVSLQFGGNRKYLLLALRKPIGVSSSANEKKAQIAIIGWKIEEAGQGRPLDAEPFMTEAAVSETASSNLMLEIAVLSDGAFRIVAATGEHEILLIDERGAISKLQLGLNSAVSALSLVQACSGRAADGSKTSPFTLVVGCRNSDVLRVQIDDHALRNLVSGSTIQPHSIVYLAHPWLRTLRGVDQHIDCPKPSAKSEDRWENLSRIEHDRWSTFNYLENWRYGKPRVDIARIHDNLVPWEKLTPDIQQYDATHVAKIPLFLDRLGRRNATKARPDQLCREIRIGIVGHRPHRLKGHLQDLNHTTNTDGPLPSGDGMDQSTFDPVVKRIQEVFTVGQNDLPIKFILVTCLAEGADRVIAEALLERGDLNAEMDVLLPLPWEIYLNTFSKDTRKHSVRQFQRLINKPRTRMHLQLPLLHGSVREVDDQKSETGKVTPQQKQFQLANAWIVQHCDYLVAAWDGREIGTNPVELGDKYLIKKLVALPDGSEEKPYTKDVQPGGTWEAVKWWLLPDSIPEPMQWPQQFASVSADDGRSWEDGLLCLGAEAAVSGLKQREKQ